MPQPRNHFLATLHDELVVLYGCFQIEVIVLVGSSQNDTIRTANKTVVIRVFENHRCHSLGNDVVSIVIIVQNDLVHPRSLNPIDLTPDRMQVSLLSYQVPCPQSRAIDDHIELLQFSSSTQAIDLSLPDNSSGILEPTQEIGQQLGDIASERHEMDAAPGTQWVVVGMAIGS